MSGQGVARFLMRKKIRRDFTNLDEIILEVNNRMTTFVAWVGVDSRGPASIYFATDSRITWRVSGTPHHWDMARKTFSSNNSPDIFAYVNHVMFPSMVLGQLVNAIDYDGVFECNEPRGNRFQKVVNHIKNSHKLYPSICQESFCIFHGAREGSGLTSVFEINRIAWNKKTGQWKIDRIEMPNESSAILIDGTGKGAVARWSNRWNSSSQGRTSRSVFSSFCNAIYSGEDHFTSGAAQLVSLYRRDSGKTIGFVESEKRFISGMEIFKNLDNPSQMKLEWRNRYFERCDSSGNLISDAKKHYVPKGLL